MLSKLTSTPPLKQETPLKLLVVSEKITGPDDVVMLTLRIKRGLREELHNRLKTLTPAISAQQYVYNALVNQLTIDQIEERK